jgi:hypothetical protein
VENGTLVVNNSSFVGNLASGGSGGGSLFSGPGGPGQGQGGAIFVYTGATYSGSGNTFMNNRGRDGAGNVSGEPDIYNLN